MNWLIRWGLIFLSLLNYILSLNFSDWFLPPAHSLVYKWEGWQGLAQVWFFHSLHKVCHHRDKVGGWVENINHFIHLIFRFYKPKLHKICPDPYADKKVWCICIDSEDFKKCCYRHEECDGIDGWSSFVLTIYCKYLYEIYILDITPPYSIHFVHGACLASVDYFQNKEQTRTDIHG